LRFIGPIDAVVLTKNSEKTLENCLRSIYKNIPLRKLIVVDGYSTDKTSEILQTFNRKYKNIKVIRDSGTRATARQKGIENVETDWFMFVDSDVELCEDWFEKAKKYIDETVGAVWGIEVWSVIQNPATLKIFLWITRKIFEIRGGTHDTLVRYDAIKDIKIPENLHVFEDSYIKEWIEQKGYKIVACYVPYCVHYRPENTWTVKGSIKIIAEALRLGSLRKIMELILAYGFYTVYVSYRSLAKKIEM